MHRLIIVCQCISKRHFRYFRKGRIGFHDFQNSVNQACLWASNEGSVVRPYRIYAIMAIAGSGITDGLFREYRYECIDSFFYLFHVETSGRIPFSGNYFNYNGEDCLLNNLRLRVSIEFCLTFRSLVNVFTNVSIVKYRPRNSFIVPIHCHFEVECSYYEDYMLRFRFNIIRQCHVKGNCYCYVIHGINHMQFPIRNRRSQYSRVFVYVFECGFVIFIAHSRGRRK